MFTCCFCACKAVFATLEELFSHLKNVHKCCRDKPNNFRCTATNCFRNFSDFNSYKCHFRINHDVHAQTKRKPNNESESHLSQSGNNKKLCAMPFVAENVNTITEHNNENATIDEHAIKLGASYNFKDVNIFKETMDHNVLLFIMKLYCNDTITRKNVQDIIVGVNSLLSSTKHLHSFLTFLRNKYEMNDTDSALVEQFTSFSQYLHEC